MYAQFSQLPLHCSNIQKHNCNHKPYENTNYLLQLLAIYVQTCVSCFNQSSTQIKYVRYFPPLHHQEALLSGVQGLRSEMRPGEGVCRWGKREGGVGGERGGRVGEPVLLELAQLAEAAAALGAAVRPLPGVDALMLVQAVEVAEPLLAEPAGVWPFARVDALVGLEAVEPAEPAAAHVAAVDLVRALPLRLHGGHVRVLHGSRCEAHAAAPAFTGRGRQLLGRDTQIADEGLQGGLLGVVLDLDSSPIFDLDPVLHHPDQTELVHVACWGPHLELKLGDVRLLLGLRHYTILLLQDSSIVLLSPHSGRIL